jgi:hypothetical protein
MHEPRLAEPLNSSHICGRLEQHRSVLSYLPFQHDIAGTADIDDNGNCPNHTPVSAAYGCGNYFLPAVIVAEDISQSARQ